METETFIEPLRCDLCRKEGIRETAEDVVESEHKAVKQNDNKNFIPTAYSKQNRLTWLYPDEIWICNQCLYRNIKQVIKGKTNIIHSKEFESKNEENTYPQNWLADDYKRRNWNKEEI